MGLEEDVPVAMVPSAVVRGKSWLRVLLSPGAGMPRLKWHRRCSASTSGHLFYASLEIQPIYTPSVINIDPFRAAMGFAHKRRGDLKLLP